MVDIEITRWVKKALCTLDQENDQDFGYLIELADTLLRLGNEKIDEILAEGAFCDLASLSTVAASLRRILSTRCLSETGIYWVFFRSFLRADGKLTIAERIDMLSMIRPANSHGWDNSAIRVYLAARQGRDQQGESYDAKAIGEAFVKFWKSTPDPPPTSHAARLLKALNNGWTLEDAFRASDIGTT
jgi:hypothetical protein